MLRHQPADRLPLTRMQTPQVLVELPPAVGALTKLRSLHLSRNRLQRLPDTLERLQELQWLDLRRNALAGVPTEAFGKMPKLTTLWLDGNPCCELLSVGDWDRDGLLAAGVAVVGCLER